MKEVNFSIEGNPFIIRFKTEYEELAANLFECIEGNPFIIRFKTNIIRVEFHHPNVLKVIHL